MNRGPPPHPAIRASRLIPWRDERAQAYRHCATERRLPHPWQLSTAQRTANVHPYR